MKIKRIAITLGLTLLLSACGTGLDEQFIEDTNTLIDKMDTAMKQPDFDSGPILSEFHFYVDRYGKDASEKQTEVLQHIDKLTVLVTSRSFEDDLTKQADLLSQYNEEVEVVKAIIE